MQNMDFLQFLSSSNMADFYQWAFYDLSPNIILILFFVALIAGFVDSIAGGGGLLVIPALLLAGIPANLAIATSKLQAWGATGYASFYFIKHGLIQPRNCKLMIFLTLIGAISGGWLVFYIDTQILKKIIPFLLLAVGFYFLIRPNMGALERERRLSPLLFALIPALLIGFYDGFFGPGTGTFFTIAFIVLAGFSLTKATAHAKLLNFTSNFSAMLYFVLFEQVIWGVGAIMLCGQILGAVVGARLVIHQGSKIIRPLLILVCFALAIKLLYQPA